MRQSTLVLTPIKHNFILFHNTLLSTRDNLCQDSKSKDKQLQLRLIVHNERLAQQLSWMFTSGRACKQHAFAEQTSNHTMQKQKQVRNGAAPSEPSLKHHITKNPRSDCVHDLWLQWTFTICRKFIWLDNLPWFNRWMHSVHQYSILLITDERSLLNTWCYVQAWASSITRHRHEPITVAIVIIHALILILYCTVLRFDVCKIIIEYWLVVYCNFLLLFTGCLKFDDGNQLL